jgi:V8-like Glu-specific endopeptidase
VLHSHPAKVVLSIRVAAVVALAAIATVAFSGPPRAAVFGSDDRSPLTKADAALLEKIGTLSSTANGAFCTAFCVAPDVIATASHCLFGTAVSPAPKLKDLVFKTAAASSSAPSSPSDTPIAGSTTATQSQNVVSGTRRLDVSPPIGAARDWAVARLAAPVCTSGGLALSTQTQSQIRNAAARGALYQIAAHADLPDSNLRRATPCATPETFASANTAAIARDFAAPSAILFHTCDTGGGSSGSPLLIDTPNGPEVVGINVGTYVLSRAVTTSQDSQSQSKSEPIANTAIWIAAIVGAVAEMNGR